MTSHGQIPDEMMMMNHGEIPEDIMMMTIIAGRLDWITFKGPFHPKPFYDSMTLWFCHHDDDDHGADGGTIPVLRPLTGKVACAKKLGSLNMSSSYTTKRRKANSGLLMSKTNCLKSQTGLKPLSAEGMRRKRGRSEQGCTHGHHQHVSGRCPSSSLLHEARPHHPHVQEDTKGHSYGCPSVPTSPWGAGAWWEHHPCGLSPTTSVLFLLLSYSEPHTSTSTKGHTMLLPFLGRCRAPRICRRKRRVKSGYIRRGRTLQGNPMVWLL